MNRIRYMYDILIMLTASRKPLKLRDITRELEERYEITISERKVKHYLNDIKREFFHAEVFSNVRGKDGGYKMNQATKDNLLRLTIEGMDEHDRNAINDAFEIAEKSPSFHYSTELIKAREKFYLVNDMKDEDYEHYLGIESKLKNKSILLKLKESMKNNKKVMLTSKYDYFEISKGTHKFSPLFVLHDSDETFVALYNDKLGYVYQNLLNITKIDQLTTPFARIDRKDKKWESHVSKSSISIREHFTIKLTIEDEDGWKFYDLQNHECDQIKRTKKTLELKFHEDYRALQFIFMMSPYCSEIQMNNKLKKMYNGRFQEKNND